MEFAYQWSQWIQIINRGTTTTTNYVQQNLQPIVAQSTDYANDNSEIVLTSTKILKLESILKSNPYGLSVMATFKNHNKLDENSRKLLCEAIVQFCIEKNHSMTVHDAEDITKQIVLMFPDELPVLLIVLIILCYSLTAYISIYIFICILRHTIT